jgi:hypothetical protein
MTAAWAFPLYLFLISLFVVPIAVVGLAVMPPGTNPDTFVLTVPLVYGHEGLAMLSFLGGFSAATSMVIVASIALSTMVSNHIVMPIWLHFRQSRGGDPGDVRNIVLLSRRLTIAAILALGYVYYHLSGGARRLPPSGSSPSWGGADPARARSAGCSGAAPRGSARASASSPASRSGATPSSCRASAPMRVTASTLANGPFGLTLLKPQALFGIEGLDPLVHTVLWSLLFNTCGFILGSLLSFPTPVERLQGASFVNVYRHSGATRGGGANLGEPRTFSSWRSASSAPRGTGAVPVARRRRRASAASCPT